MQHIFYFDGDSKKIAWSIQSDGKTIKQSRIHADIYLDKVSDLQSKYIAFHVGIFWSIGVFIIKNEDRIKIMIDGKEMYDHLNSDKLVNDEFIKKRTFFIKKLIRQRKLKIEYELTVPEKNIAKNVLNAKEFKTGNDL